MHGAHDGQRRLRLAESFETALNMAEGVALVAFIDSVDRGILPGVLELVQDDLGFSDTQAGFLGSIAVLMSFVVTIPAGYMADRLRRTRVIAICLATWGAISPST